MKRNAALLLTLLLPSLASAQSSSPRVFVVPFQVLGAGGSELVTGKLSEQLVDDLKGRTSVLVTVTDPVTPSTDEGASLVGNDPGMNQMLAGARRHARIGAGLMKIERYEEAMTELNEAIRLYEGNLAHLKPSDFDELLQTFLQLSTTAMRAGYEDEAEEAIAQVVRMSGDFNPAGKGLPPIYQKIVARHKRKLDKQGAGTLELISNPPTAKVFIDGKEHGETPVTLKKVSAGEHYVQLARPLAGVWADKIVFPGRNKTSKKVIDLPPIDGEAQLKDDEEAANAAARASLEAVLAILRTGLADETLKKRTVELALRTGTDYVVCGFVATLPTGYRLRPMILRTDGSALADLGRVQFDFELLGSAMQMRELGDQVVAALSKFPDTLVPDKAPKAMVAAAQLVAAAAEAAPEVVAGGLPPGEPVPMLSARPALQPGPDEQQPLPPAEFPDMPLEALASGTASMTIAAAAARAPAPIAAPPTAAPPVAAPPVAAPPVAAPPAAAPPVAAPPTAAPPVAAPTTAPRAAAPPVAAVHQTPPPAASSMPPAWQTAAAPVFPPPLAPPPAAATAPPALPATARPAVAAPAVPAQAPVHSAPPAAMPPLAARPAVASPTAAHVAPPAAPPPAGAPSPGAFPPPLPPRSPAGGAAGAARPAAAAPLVASATPAQPAAPAPGYQPGRPLASRPASPQAILPPPVEQAYLPASSAAGPGSGPDDGESYEKWYQRWWVWGAAAAVVGGGATAAVLLLGEQASPRPAKGVVPEVSFR